MPVYDPCNQQTDPVEAVVRTIDLSDEGRQAEYLSAKWSSGWFRRYQPSVTKVVDGSRTSDTTRSDFSLDVSPEEAWTYHRLPAHSVEPRRLIVHRGGVKKLKPLYAAETWKERHSICIPFH